MPERPNVLLLFTDQQRFDTIAACGFNHMLTPNLDRLVRQGCTYTNAYSPNPICVPARHNLMTGLPARFHGYAGNDTHPLDPGIPTLPRILSDNNYETRAIGKMHFRPRRRHNGFDKMELMEEVPLYRESDEYAMYLKQVGFGHILNIHGVRNLLYMLPQRSLIPEEHHGSTWVGNRSAHFIRTNAGRHPFFLWSSWIAPHPPFDIPDTFADLYKNRPLPEPYRTETPLSPLVTKQKDYADIPEGRTKEYIRRIREMYYSAISLVDKNVGRIIEALEDTGLIDNTVVIFTSDHGEMLGDYGLWQKMLPYDSCSRIPFVIRYPEKFKPGTICNEFVDLNDILPTILDLAGIAYPGPFSLPGGSLLKNDKDRTYQFMEFHQSYGRIISVRDKQYKYNYYYDGPREQLFDMLVDPHETTNLLAVSKDNPEIAGTRTRLNGVLHGFEAKWGLKNYTLGNDFIRIASKPVSNLPARCGNFPKIHEKITDPEEKAKMNTFEQEVLQVIEKEPLVKLHELDLDSWLRNGASPEFVERIRKEKL